MVQRKNGDYTPGKCLPVVGKDGDHEGERKRERERESLEEREKERERERERKREGEEHFSSSSSACVGPDSYTTGKEEEQSASVLHHFSRKATFMGMKRKDIFS